MLSNSSMNKVDYWRRQLWGTCFPSTSSCLIFQVTSQPHKLWHSTPRGCLSSKNIQALSFVAVYRMMNFIIFLCVTHKLFFSYFDTSTRTKCWRRHCGAPLIRYDVVWPGSWPVTFGGWARDFLGGRGTGREQILEKLLRLLCLS